MKRASKFYQSGRRVVALESSLCDCVGCCPWGVTVKHNKHQLRDLIESRKDMDRSMGLGTLITVATVFHRQTSKYTLELYTAAVCTCSHVTCIRP